MSSEMESVESLTNIPLKFMPISIRDEICKGLDQRKVSETKETICRDYRGVAQIISLDAASVTDAEMSGEPTDHILTSWEKKNPNVSLKDLFYVLQRIERFDIIDDFWPRLIENIPKIQRVLMQPESLTLNLISRCEWNAQQPRSGQPKLLIPVSLIFLRCCYYDGEDDEVVRKMQRVAMVRCGAFDIDCNFAIGKSSSIYEGTGWERPSGHSFRYSHFSLVLTFIGNWKNEVPDQCTIDAVLQLLDYGVQMGFVEDDHGIYFIKQEQEEFKFGSECRRIIEKWPKFEALGELEEESV